MSNLFGNLGRHPTVKVLLLIVDPRGWYINSNESGQSDLTNDLGLFVKHL